MSYYDAEIMVKDVNPTNTRFFEEGWLYVSSLKNQEAPMYLAPYLTGKGANSGISMISRVVGTRAVVLADTQDTFEPATDEQRERWSKGLRMLREHAEASGFADALLRLYFLDRPIAFGPKPLTKKALYQAGITKGKKPLGMIPIGFTLRFDQLLAHGLMMHHLHN